jgi:hypothetical protein
MLNPETSMPGAATLTTAPPSPAEIELARVSGQALAPRDRAQQLADGDGIALVAAVALDDARLLGWHLDVDLVRLQFDHWLAAGDLLARLLEPLNDDRIHDRLAKGWDPNLDRHMFLFV